ncbi:uncharacterized protein LOC113228397 isoform X3 [Hyposmocoma kahamanoa]|uniref:uncharacterized protein LOC113228397 isoform X2 n=1 Tax=Hyposmocoma kahamanoa TaxID=1477025 RepID=UPI000E6D97AC|nr:uncharacterized protein LOC113228397 isoform X2 [Hyposmocoma kahamanoa]XP_026317461.1 uncharacterized protein LOC113228397 isoform X3 [Hyposmocoma kahamanoa]
MSTTGSDIKMVENLRRQLMTNNNDYELHEARVASDRALEAANENGTRAPEPTPSTGYVKNLTFDATNSTLSDREVDNLKSALNEAMRLAERQIATATPVTSRRRSYRIYRHPNRRINGDVGVGVTFTVKRFKFRPIS